jgi:spore germination protein YaaH
LTMIATVSSVPNQVALFSATSLMQPTVLVAVDATQVLSDEAGKLANIVAPGGLTPTLDGKLTGSLAPGYDASKGYLVMPVIRNYTDPRAVDTNTITTILGNSSLRSQHAAQITGFATNNAFKGVFVDYQEVPVDLRESYSTFITELVGCCANKG